MHRSYTLVKFLKCFYTILNFQLLVASPEKCFLHVDLVFSDHPGPPSGLGQRLLSSASHKGCWPPTSLRTGHQWPCPSHLAVTQLTCHSPLCLRDFYSGFYSLFISRYLSTCVTSLPVTFIYASCQHPKQEILVSVSPPGPTRLGLSSPDLLPLGQAPMLSHQLCGCNRWQGVSKAVCVQVPVRPPALGGSQALLLSSEQKISLFQQFLLMLGQPGRKVFVSPWAHHGTHVCFTLLHQNVVWGVQHSNSNMTKIKQHYARMNVLLQSRILRIRLVLCYSKGRPWPQCWKSLETGTVSKPETF